MQSQLHLTVEEYFALDAAAPEGTRYEYFDGTIYAMAGASPDHNQIAANALTQLNNRLPEHCRIVGSDQRVRLYIGKAYFYPDVVAACDPEYDGITLLNPDLVVEVLSESTEARDLSQKLDAYFALDSVKEYWVLAQTEPRVLQYERTADGWLLKILHGLDARLRSGHFGLDLPLADLYRRVF